MYKPAKTLISGLHLMLLSRHTTVTTHYCHDILLTTFALAHTRQPPEILDLRELSHLMQDEDVSLMLHCLHHGLCKHITSTLIQKHTTAYYMSLQTTYCIDFILSVLTEIIAKHNIDEHKAERASPSH